MKKLLLLATLICSACFAEITPSPTPTAGHFTGKYERAEGPLGGYAIWGEYELPDGTRVWIIVKIVEGA